MNSMVNRISLTPANSSRQPSSFPRNVPSRSTFHSGINDFMIFSHFHLLTQLSSQVKLELVIVARREQRAQIHTPIRAAVFYKEFQTASVNGE